MAFWTFMDYCTEDGRIPIREWYEGQTPDVRAAFDATLFELKGTRNWLDPRVKRFKILTERHSGLSELIFDVEVQEGSRRYKRKFRPAGIWRPQVRDFILLVGCEKSGRIYIPTRAFEMALEYKAQFEQGRGKICEHV